MENASKALIMAASVLIAIMVLSLGVYLFSIFGGTSQEITNIITESQISEFNSNLTKYEGKTDIREQCSDVQINEETGMVNKIIFEKI